MFDRIVRGPAVALDIEPDANATEIRAAFHTLAKQYHPARFGRMSHGTQRLANEVFLGLRTAHDGLMKAQAGRQTTAVGVGLPKRRPGETEPPPIAGRAMQSGPPLRPQQSPQQRQTGPVAIQRPVVAPTTNHGTAPIQRPAVAPTTNHGTGPRTAPAAGTGPRPLPTRAPAGPPSRPTPAGPLPIPPGARSTTQANPTVARTQTQPVESVRIGGTRPPGANPRIVSAIELLNRGQWDLARSALASLVQESPESNQLQALFAYATGRQAQVERRLDEARVELNRALQFDPDLALAKTALAELFARRK